ncbi:MAG: MogA/MoaB family molybdenum cofactor biosynthesis protein [archaeon]|nr:molybdopterin-binding protein [Candidatus Bathyarchaeum sp.]
MTEKLNRNTHTINFALIICNSILYEKFRKNQQFSNPLSDLIDNLVTSAGYAVVSIQFLPDDRVMLGKQVGNVITSESVDAIIVCGGTGLRISEITLECLRPLMVKTMPGFAEIFRKLIYEKIGLRAITLRALAGITDHEKVLFCIPESLDSVKLVITQLILPDIENILEKVQKS